MDVMKVWKPVMISLLFSLMFQLSACASDSIRIVCVGNSITAGYGLVDWTKQSYPARLQILLGSKYTVRNCGVSGRTMLKKGDSPYWNEIMYKEAKNFNPDIVIISLGTNDCQKQNWIYKDEFYNDYVAMVNEFRANGKNPHIFVCLPPPIYVDIYSYTDSILRKQVIPLIDSVCITQKTSRIDFYHPMLPYSGFFQDGLHPDSIGALIMARIVYDAIKTELKVTSVISPKSGILLGNSESVSITVNNNKPFAINNVPVAYKIDGKATVKENIESIPAQSEIRFRFSHTVDLSQKKDYKLTVWTAVDSLQKNDTIVANVSSLEPLKNYSMFVSEGNIKACTKHRESIAPDAFTAEAWVYPKRFNSDVYCGTILSKESRDQSGYALGIYGNGRARISIGKGNAWLEAMAPLQSVQLDKWSHIAGVYDGRNLKIYVNGILQKVTNGVGEIHQSTSSFIIGASSAYAGRGFEGNIDEVRFWNRALTGDEILAYKDVRLSGYEEGLCVYYDFNGGSSSEILKDLSFNGNIGYIYNMNAGYNWAEGLELADTIDSPRLKENGIFFWPNPVKDVLNILFAKDSCENVTLTDMMGRKFFCLDLEGKNEFHLDVSKFPQGIYLLSFINASSRISYKIIIGY